MSGGRDPVALRYRVLLCIALAVGAAACVEHATDSPPQGELAAAIQSCSLGEEGVRELNVRFRPTSETPPEILSLLERLALHSYVWRPSTFPSDAALPGEGDASPDIGPGIQLIEPRPTALRGAPPTARVPLQDGAPGIVFESLLLRVSARPVWRAIHGSGGGWCGQRLAE
jgi:hypothetical protein